MKQIQLGDITPRDLNEFPVWYFPGEEEFADELTIRPVAEPSELGDHEVIVRAAFNDALGRIFLGYIFWMEPQVLKYLQPVMFLDASGDLRFRSWAGSFAPELEDFEQARGILSKNSFPISFESEEHFGLYPIRGTLHGIYYLDLDEKAVRCKEIPF